MRQRDRDAPGFLEERLFAESPETGGVFGLEVELFTHVPRSTAITTVESIIAPVAKSSDRMTPVGVGIVPNGQTPTRRFFRF